MTSGRFLVMRYGPLIGRPRGSRKYVRVVHWCFSLTSALRAAADLQPWFGAGIWIAERERPAHRPARKAGVR